MGPESSSLFSFVHFACRPKVHLFLNVLFFFSCITILCVLRLSCTISVLQYVCPALLLPLFIHTCLALHLFCISLVLCYTCAVFFLFYNVPASFPQTCPVQHPCVPCSALHLSFHSLTNLAIQLSASLHLSHTTPALHFTSCSALHQILPSPTPLLHHPYPSTRTCSLPTYCPTSVTFKNALQSLLTLRRASIFHSLNNLILRQAPYTSPT